VVKFQGILGLEAAEVYEWAKRVDDPRATLLADSVGQQGIQEGASLPEDAGGRRRRGGLPERGGRRCREDGRRLGGTLPAEDESDPHQDDGHADRTQEKAAATPHEVWPVSG